jgi:uncharacterized membrane protein
VIEDPYRTPKAHLEAPSPYPATRPREVKIAALLIAVSVVIVFIAVAIATLGGRTKTELDVEDAAWPAVLLILASQIFAGRNWSRWMFAVIVAFIAFAHVVMAFLLVTVPATRAGFHWEVYALGILQLMLQVAAIVLAFSSRAGPWFTRPHPAG